MPKGSRVAPTKLHEKVAPNASHHTVKVVTNHRLGSGLHSDVFPHHIGDNHWHGGHGTSVRNPHGSAHTVTSKGRAAGK
jgi:hypothetical protein